MRKRDEWIERIKAVEVEYLVAVLAVELLRDHLHTEPHLLTGGLEVSDVTRTATNLEATYLVRMFAVFEAGLREVWRQSLSRDTQPLMRDLLNGVAARRRIPPGVLDAAHRVREFRNVLVHEQDEEPEETFTIGQARRHLTRFFSYLPPDW
jgi:hypothetical protein